MKRLLKWGCLVTTGLVVLFAVMAWRQIRQIRENLAVSTPLAVPIVARDPHKVAALVEQAQRVEEDRVLRLKDPELTYIAQRAVRHPEVLALLENARRRALKALDQVPDPLGFLDGLRLDAVDLSRLRTEVRAADSQLVLRMTAPYLDGQHHLNLDLAVTGGWAPGAIRLEVKRLVIGELDVLALPIYGRWVHTQVAAGVAAAARVDEGGPLQDVRVEANALVLRLTPSGARQLAGLAREYLR